MSGGAAADRPGQELSGLSRAELPGFQTLQLLPELLSLAERLHLRPHKSVVIEDRPAAAVVAEQIQVRADGGRIDRPLDAFRADLRPTGQAAAAQSDQHEQRAFQQRQVNHGLYSVEAVWAGRAAIAAVGGLAGRIATIAPDHRPQFAGVSVRIRIHRRCFRRHPGPVAAS